MVVDVHTHIYPPRYLDRLRERNEIPRLAAVDGGEALVIFPDAAQAASGPRPMGPEYTLLERKLQYMAEHGIDLSVLSVGNPWVDFMTPADAAYWATALNEELEDLCAASGGRFLGLGMVPLQDPAAAARELERIAALPHLRGAVIGTRPGGGHLDDPVLAPFWERAAGEQTPLFVHPHYTVGADWMTGYGGALIPGLGFTFETTVAVTRLILGGVLDRYPGLRLVLAHGGGTLPYLAGRLDVCTGVADRNRRRPFSEYLKELYYDALVYAAPPLLAALALVGPERLLFGTDHPFPIAHPASNYAAVRTAAPEHAEAILAGNARRLLRL